MVPTEHMNPVGQKLARNEISCVGWKPMYRGDTFIFCTIIPKGSSV